METTISELNTPLKITDKVTIKNRFFKSAMSEALGTKGHGPSEKEDGIPGGHRVCIRWKVPLHTAMQTSDRGEQIREHTNTKNKSRGTCQSDHCGHW